VRRPGLQELLSDVADGLVDIVVVHRLDRLSPQSAMTRRNPHKQAIADKKTNWEPVGFLIWWSWRELNPRPQAIFVQFYMCSRLI